MATVAGETAVVFVRALGYLGKTRCWLFHPKSGWAFDVWTTQNMHALSKRVVVLVPNFETGALALYLATYHPGLFKPAAKPPTPLHAPFVLDLTGKGWRTMANEIDQELLALVGIEQGTGLSRQVA